ncbi:MAG TPA: two-component regulator propeller domain-containing protein, partial [Blastocatellia bacterium]|nr:two-component regulator propeller domain-containing protein [Blastocatellia bacterium]
MSLSARIFIVVLLMLSSALTASVALSQQDAEPKETEPNVAAPESEAAKEKSEEIANSATLNLHRWGAVTLFHGLPSDRVNAIAEDDKGALWFGTDSGLVRYDGRRTQLVGSEGSGTNQNTGLLPSSRIRSLKRDRTGALWIGTDAGAVRYFKYKLELVGETRGRAVTGIAESPQGEIAFVTEQGEIFHVNPSNSDISRTQGRNDTALTATKIDRSTQPLLGLTADSGTPQSIQLSSIEFLKNSERGGEWLIGSRSRGLMVHRDSQLREAALRPPRPYFVLSVHVVNDRVWIGAQAGRNESGLWSYQAGAASPLTRFAIDTGSVTALNGGDGEMWVGTDANGVFLLRNETVVEHLTFENTAGGLRSNHINTIYRDHEGVVWFGTDRGVCLYDRDSFRTTTLRERGNSNFVRSMLVASNGDVWAGTNRGLFKLEAGYELGPWTQVEEIGDLAVYALREAGQGTIYARTSNGLFVKKDSGFAELLQNGEGGKVSEASIAIGNDSSADTTGRKWRGTHDGLYVLDSKGERKVISGIDVQALLAVREESDANLREVVYCATKNAGLIKLLAETETSIRFDTEQGLPSQQIFSLAEDKKTHAIWIGTNRGVVRYQPSSIAPRLEARRLVADQVYEPEYLKAELRFPSTQSSFLLEVAALGSRTFPSQFQYEYTLEQKDRGVLKTLKTSDSQFVLEGMKPGEYSIIVRALSRDLVYSNPLKIKIWIARAPLPWTSIFLGMLLSVAVIAGAWAYRNQRKTARANLELEKTNDELREMRIRLAHETEAERSRIARDLHDQTLGDLRHLLVMTDQLPNPNSEDAANSTTPTPVELRRNIEEIAQEIRQICEDLSPSVLVNIGFLPALEWALSNAVAHLPTEEKFNYQFIADTDLEDRLSLTETERIQLYRIIQEVINNICKHANARNVSLSVQVENEHD